MASKYGFVRWVNSVLSDFFYRRRWKRAAVILSVFVMLGTVLALMLPGITLSAGLFCDIEEHTHTQACYAEGTRIGPTCTPKVHVHEDGCYDSVGTMICGQTDFLLHTHEGLCYDEAGELICSLSEVKAHTHGALCYQNTTVTVDPGHTHTDACYAWTPGTNIVCTEEERPGHLHKDGCYNEDGTLGCTTTEDPGHMHGPECFEKIKGDLICTETERDPVTQPGEPVVICPEPEIIVHVHGTTCFVTGTYDCGQGQAQTHVHGEECLGKLPELICGKEEHTHNDACYRELTQQEQAAVDTLNSQIQALPPISQIEAKLAELKQAGDKSALKAYQNELASQLWAVLSSYDALSVTVQSAVDNADVLSDYRELFNSLDPNSAPLEGQRFQVTSTDGSVTAQVTVEEDLPEGAAFCVDTNLINTARVNQTETAVQNALATLGLEAREILPLDLYFVDAQGNTIPNVGKAEVTLTFDTPVLAGEGGIMAYHITENGAQGVLQSVVRDEQGVHQVTLRTDGFSPYALAATNANRTVKIKAINNFSWTVGLSTLYNAGKKVGIGLPYWVAVVVEPVENHYEVTKIYNSGTDKTNVASSSKGFVVVYNEGTNYTGPIDVSVGDWVTWDNTNWNTTSALGYKEAGYCNITFTSAGKLKNEKNNGLTPIGSADTSQFVNINLYDYGSGAGKANINTLYNNNSKYPGFQQEYGTGNTGVGTTWGGGDFNFGNNVTSDIADGNNGLTNQGGLINQVQKGTVYSSQLGKNVEITAADFPIQYREGNNLSGAITFDHPTSGVLNDTLINGYPALSDGTSLAYLFSESTYAKHINRDADGTVHNINGLFQLSATEGYNFNSRTNAAIYNRDSYQFDLYSQIITPNYMMYPFGNFMPLNDINTLAKQSSQMTREYLLEIADSADWKQSNGYSLDGDEYGKLAGDLREFVALMDTTYGTGWTPEQAVNKYFEISGIPKRFTRDELANTYTIDYDEPSDFYFGMDITMNLMQPKNGLTGPNGDQQMFFYFTGDDDVWVYLDGYLTLDLAGIHRHVGGAIDFQKGTVIYFGLDKATGDVGITIDSAYKFVHFEDIFPADMLVAPEGETRDHDNSRVYRFKDYDVHEFKFYYMERGSGSSVCRINFNFPVLRQNSISVTKALDVDGTAEEIALLGDPDFRFRVVDGDDPDQLFIGPGEEYDIVDSAGNIIGTGVTDEHGIFTLKATQTAVFGGINENSGTYYVEELLDPNEFAQYGTVTVDGSSNTEYYNVTVGQDSFTGFKSPVKNVSDGSTTFTFHNHVDFNDLGSLSVEKTLDRYDPSVQTPLTFDFLVELDGSPIPVGTVYTVDGQTRTVTQAGIVTLAPGEKALIQKILAGSQFRVQETAASAAGSTVTYQGIHTCSQNPCTHDPGITMGTDDTGQYITGIIQHDATVETRIHNTEDGAQLTIPVIKHLLNPDGETHTFTFELVQVTDSTGQTPVENGTRQTTQAVFSPGDSQKPIGFLLTYLSRDIQPLPTVFYYRIAEQGNAAQPYVAFDATGYVAEVTVSKAADGPLTAAVTAVWKNGELQPTLTEETVAFQNSLLADLTIGKQMAGLVDFETDFTFTVTLRQGEQPLNGPFTAQKTAADGTVTELSLAFTNGLDVITLKHAEQVTIQKLPAGVTWTVTETNAEGYSTTFQMDAGEPVDGKAATGVLPGGSHRVDFVNYSGYMLPNTGGAGTLLYTLGGLSMMGSAVLMYSHKQKRRKEEQT